MSGFRIHGFAGSTFTRTARMACIEKGASHTLSPLQFGAGSHRALHPFLKMPVLEHGAVRVFETLAITSYVDAVGPGPALRPPGLLEHTAMLQWVSVACDYLYTDLVGALLGDGAPGVAPAAAALTSAGAHLDVLDARLHGEPFLAGKQLSLADLFVAPIVGFAAGKGLALEPGRRPGLARWWQALQARPSFVETAS